MNIIPDKYVYLLALIPFTIIWVFLFLKKKDLKKEFFYISLFIGIASVVTSYFWWTKDWWRPLTITNTIVGLEDFIMGFTAGGIMSVIYDFLINKDCTRYKIIHSRYSFIWLCGSMICITSLLISLGTTSFWASKIALIFGILFINYSRKDLIINSLISGISMLLISIFFYWAIISFSNTWINNTYLNGLSGLRIYNVPIEEFVFWLLAGMWVGPFYEFMCGKRTVCFEKSR